METIKDYEVLGVEVDVVYFVTKHGDKSFPRVKDIFHSDVRITELIDHNILEKIEAELFKGLNDLVTK
ncbi:MAG: hypothetical protein ACXADH_12175 [Candidatus Kariarchaeaceae archaeon]|jgi:hypothetical protein